MRTIFVFLLLLLVSGICFSQEETEAPIVNCLPTVRVDEFEFLSIANAKERLDLYGLRIRNAKARGIVIGYGGKDTESNEGRKLAVEVMQYLNSRFDFDYADIYVLDGGHRSHKSVELFIKYSSCSPDPEVSPSLAVDDVNYREEKQFFDKATIPKTTAELKGLIVKETKPNYPAAARAVRARGKVIVLVQIDESGLVDKVLAVDGHPLLRKAAEITIKQFSFRTITTEDKSVKYGGKMVIDFDQLLDEYTDHF